MKRYLSQPAFVLAPILFIVMICCTTHSLRASPLDTPQNKPDALTSNPARSSVPPKDPLSLGLDKKQGKIQFTAIGNPSSLRIIGSGEGPAGSFSIRRRPGAQQGQQVEITGELTADLSSFETGLRLRDRHMKEKYLQTAQFPHARISLAPLLLPLGNFTAQEWEQNIEFSGMLRFHGQERDIQGRAEIRKQEKQLRIIARFPIRLTDYSIDLPAFAGITVAETVEVEAEFQVAAPEAL